MQGLYKRVIKGAYPKIPSHYSVDLSTILKYMIQVQANLRPNCGIVLIILNRLIDQILAHPNVESRFKRYFPDEYSKIMGKYMNDTSNDQLLRTIKISNNLFSLTERLPKPKYRNIKQANMNYSTLSQEPSLNLISAHVKANNSVLNNY